MKRSTRKWVAAELDEDTHRTLYNYATEIGDHPSKIVERFVVEGLEKAAEEAKNPSLTMRTFLAVQRTLHKEQVRSQLGRIAWSAMALSDEDGFDTLRTLCEEHGVTVNEIIESQKAMTEAPIVVRDNGRGIGSATKWLQQQFGEHPQYPSRQIVKMGKEAGFSQPVLNAAKRKAGLVSMRASSHWIWTYPDTPPVESDFPDDDPF